MKKLTDRGIRALEPAPNGKLKMYADRDGVTGLYLRVTKAGTKQWVLRCMIAGERTDLGLGGFPTIGLAAARDIARERRAMIAKGGDPREAKREARLARERQAAEPTFAEAIEAVIANKASGWRAGGRSEYDWRVSLDRYAAPLMDMRLSNIRRADVLAALDPIWHEKPVTAQRVWRRIRAVMEWATARDIVPFNVAAFDATIALGKNITARRHHAALPHTELGAALAAFDRENIFLSHKLVIRFAALTAGRSTECRAAVWAEIDREAAVWTVPAERMKAGKEHRVPLSTAALAVLAKASILTACEPGDLIFPSVRGGCITVSILCIHLRGFSGGEWTMHGLRTSFRSWCADNGIASDVAEQCLAHTVKGVEGVYQRSDLLERRRPVMEAWGRYLSGETAEDATPLRRVANIAEYKAQVAVRAGGAK